MAAEPLKLAPRNRAPEYEFVPQSLEAEEAVVGSIIVDPAAIAEVADFLRPDHFLHETCKWIYGAALTLYRAGAAVDYLTIAQGLRDANRLEAVGGTAYLAGLFNTFPTSAHVEHYAHIVERLAVRRRVVGAGSDIAKLAYDLDDPDTLSEQAQRALLRALERPGDEDMRRVSDVLQDEAQRMTEDAPAGIPTGLTDLDRMLGGLKRGKLYVVGGRPGHGKTSLMLSMVPAFCRCGHRVAVFSLEMRDVEIVQRLIAVTQSINVKAIEDKSLDDRALDRYYSGSAEIDGWPLLIDASEDMTPAAIAAKCRRATRQGGLGLVVVDYLQLMSRKTTQADRVAEMSTISRAMKLLAKSLDCPVVVGSQLTRAVEGREGRRPNLHDLRESGQIEADADCVLLMYNERAADRKKGVAQSGEIEIDVAKQRNGPIGVVGAYFNAEYTRFGNLAKE